MLLSASSASSASLSVCASDVRSLPSPAEFVVGFSLERGRTGRCTEALSANTARSSLLCFSLLLLHLLLSCSSSDRCASHAGGLRQSNVSVPLLQRRVEVDHSNEVDTVDLLPFSDSVER